MEKSSLSSFITAITTALTKAIVNGDITYGEKLIKCEKCGKTVTEYSLNVVAYVTVIFRIPIKVSLRICYDPSCGLAYIRS